MYILTPEAIELFLGIKLGKFVNGINIYFIFYFY